MRSSVILCFLLCLALPAHADKKPAAPPEIFVDAVVASVNGKPITLKDLCKRLNPPRDISFRDASLDPEARFVLDQIILDRLIEEQAAAQKITVDDQDIDGYINEIATRNNLSREGFEQALASEHKKMSEYREQVRLEILRSRVAGRLMHGGPGVTEKEIDQYIEQHPELLRSGAKLKLSQIFVARSGKSEEEFTQKISEIESQLKEHGDFAGLAEKYSESPDAAEGGSLGVIAEGDLSSEIFEAVFSLKEGESSQPLQSEDGARIFFVEKRLTGEEGDSQAAGIREEVRKGLEQQKSQAKMQGYFITELQKLHSVDKKI